MKLALEARARADDIIIGETPKAKQRRKRLADLTPAGRLCKHSTLRDIDGIVDVPAMQDYFVFTIGRNPWDRMVSYYHWAREQSFDHPVVRAAAEHDFAEFCITPCLASVTGVPISQLCSGPIWRRSLQFVCALGTSDIGFGPTSGSSGVSH